MKKKFRVFFALFTITFLSFGIEPIGDTCRFYIDLNKCKNNRLEVVFIPPQITSDTIVYRLPATVPGTYEILDYGRFVTSFKAVATDGSLLLYDSLDVNSRKIKNATRLGKIIYEIEDTWHSEKAGTFIFEPAGTNIEPAKNFVVNTFGFFGYIDGLRQCPVSLNIIHPRNLYGSTNMEDHATDMDKDIFIAPDYIRLADSPVMYCEPDTSMLHIGGADILVSVYSQNKKISSRFIADKIKEILEAQKNYLGGQLPIKKYAFIIYLFKGESRSGSTGALEHSYSSFYYLEETSPEQIVQEIRNVAAHEFFHIVTPLGIHSREIGDFDFASPQMSKHLWLYEGVTEYFAGHVQVKYGIIKKEEYLKMLRDKLEFSMFFNDTLPFTRMSTGCLDQYKNEYLNVYEKGALIGMCLDIKLLSLSGGKYGLDNLMMDLFKKYGPDKSFNDDELIDTIVAMTHLGMKDFFNRYVEGNEPLPFEEIFSMVGIKYEKNKNILITNILGGAKVEYNEATGRFLVKKITRISKKMGLRENDELVSVNNTIVNAENISSLIKYERDASSLPIPMEVIVRRKKISGKQKELKFKSKTLSALYVKKHIEFEKNCTEDKLLLRQQWLEVTKKTNE